MTSFSVTCSRPGERSMADASPGGPAVSFAMAHGGRKESGQRACRCDCVEALRRVRLSVDHIGGCITLFIFVHAALLCWGLSPCSPLLWICRLKTRDLTRIQRLSRARSAACCGW